MTPLLIPIFIPHVACPHRCVFCNQHTITGQNATPLPDMHDVRKTIQEFLSFSTPRAERQLAFYGGTFLGLPLSELTRLLDMAQALVEEFCLDGIRFSTRPDTVTAKTISLLQNYPISMVELGAQSMADDVLLASGRGHTAQDTIDAAGLLRKDSFPTTIQMMLGLPGDSAEKAVASGEKIVSLSPAAVRIYPTVVFKDTPLAERYHAKKYRPLSVDESADISARLLKLFLEHNISVVRMGLPVSDNVNPLEIVAGPWHPAFGELVWTAFFKNSLLEEVAKYSSLPSRVTISVHPSYLSRVRGHQNKNIQFLSHKFPQTQFSFRPNDTLSSDSPEIHIEL